MAQNKIEIDVLLNADKAEKDLRNIEKGASSVGESFTSLGKTVATTGGDINQKLGKVGESAGDLVGAFQKMGQSVTATGSSFTAMLGPIGVAVVAVAELTQSFRDYSNEVTGVNLRVEAYKAAASELTSIIEELSDAQVNLTKQQIIAFRTQSLLAQQNIEEAQQLRERSGLIVKEVEAIKQRIASIRKNAEEQRANAKATFYSGVARRQAMAELERLQKRLNELIDKETALTQKGAKERVKLEQMKKEALKASPEFIKKIAEQEAKLLEDARLAGLEREKETVKGQIEIAKVGSQRRIRELKAIEDISESVRSQAIAAERKRLEAEITKIRKDASEKRRAELDQQRQREAAAAKLQAAKELALERQKQAELTQLRALELQQMKVDGVSALEILRLRYEDELALAGDNINKMLIAQSRFDLERSRLEQSAAEEQARRQKEMTELHRKNELARLQATKESINQQMEMVKSLTERYGAGIAEAAYSAAIMGESFSKAVGETLIALGKQSAVQALISTAEGIAALFVNPALAGSKFSAAAAFTAAAAAAGAAGSALGGGSGGGVPSSGGTAAATSPSGLAQTAPAPERERAETSPMVFNVNFSGAVIYDTQRAAEQALADRITNLQNRQRRGGPMRRG